jgi:undecaprenyl diphosphate synthase
MLQDGVSAKEVNIELINQYLFTVGSPDPDLIIRTSGELRTSNFLIWQSAYSEWYITPTFWPDFDKEEYAKALKTYADRDRRYGGVSDEHYE